jgi:hypothetical protein
MQLSQPGREPQQELHALEFVEPILRHGYGERSVGSAQPSRARCAKLVVGQLAIFGQCSVAQETHELTILVEKHDNRHAPAAANLERLGQLRISVAILKAEIDRRSGLGEMIEDRALIHAIAAPCAGQAQHPHLAAKTAEQLALRVGELDCVVQGRPAPAMLVGAEFSEKILVGESVLEMRGEVDHRGT